MNPVRKATCGEVSAARVLTTGEVEAAGGRLFVKELDAGKSSAKVTLG